MTAPDRCQWRRDKDGLGVWEHRSKVAVAGVGHSPVGQREDFLRALASSQITDTPSHRSL